MQRKRLVNEEAIFEDTKRSGRRLVKLSIIELVGIVLLAGVQLFVIRGFLTKRMVI